jgi:hypothetical protein
MSNLDSERNETNNNGQGKDRLIDYTVDKGVNPNDQNHVPTSANFNSSAAFWRYEIGANIIPMDSRKKTPLVPWKEWQDKPIPEDVHNQWVNENLFMNGMAVICGKLWHNPLNAGKFLVAIDCDNKISVKMFLNGQTIEDLAIKTIVEQHLDNPDRMHLYFLCDRPIRNRNSNANIRAKEARTDEIPVFEVKSTGKSLICCTCSIHTNGQPYEILGTKIPLFVKAAEVESDISSWCKKFGISYLDVDSNNKSLLPIEQLFKTETKILEGENRHEGLLRVMESLLQRNKTVVPVETIKKWAYDQNQNFCVPPLEEQEFEKQWIDAMQFIEKKNNENANQPQTQKPTEILAEQIESAIPQLFKDQFSTPYAQVKILDHEEIISLESNRFKRYLSKFYYDNNDHRIASTETINNVIQILQAKAEYENPTIPLYLRVAWSKEKDAVYYDLTDEKWRAIRITKGSWVITNNPPIMFKRYNQKPQLEPNRMYEPQIFDKFIDLTNIAGWENILLLKVYIVSLLIPDIAHVILVLIGEKGSAKTLLEKMIKSLVDPSKPELLTIHNDRSEFIQQIAHSYLPYYDNVKYVPKWLSDEACKAVTGIGQTKRKLYSDDEDFVSEYKHCLGFNGINMSLTEPDARDRIILIQLRRIGKENRKQESEILSKFEELKPQLLGYILDILVKALEIKDSIKLNDLPRMADFAIWGEAIARSMGYNPLDFLNAYYNNIGRQNIEAIEADPLAQTVVKLIDELDVDGTKEWFGLTTDCVEKLNDVAARNKLNHESKSFPKSANSLSRHLNRISSNLLEGVGIEVLIDRVKTDRDPRFKKNTSTIRIRKIPPPSPLDENQAKSG